MSRIMACHPRADRASNLTATAALRCDRGHRKGRATCKKTPRVGGAGRVAGVVSRNEPSEDLFRANSSGLDSASRRDDNRVASRRFPQEFAESSKGRPLVKTQARVVVIGGGAVGCSILFLLTED